MSKEKKNILKENSLQNTYRHLCHEIIIRLMEEKKLQSLYMIQLHVNKAIKSLEEKGVS